MKVNGQVKHFLLESDQGDLCTATSINDYVSRQIKKRSIGYRLDITFFLAQAKLGYSDNKRIN